jgi:hypothetical protein
VCRRPPKAFGAAASITLPAFGNTEIPLPYDALQLVCCAHTAALRRRLGSFADSKIAHPVREPKVVGTSRCDVPVRAERAEHSRYNVVPRSLRRCMRRWTAVAAPLAKSAILTTRRPEALIKWSIKSIRQPHDIRRGHDAERFDAELLGIQVVMKADQHCLLLMNVR